jgi:hypothetical protein
MDFKNMDISGNDLIYACIILIISYLYYIFIVTNLL